MPISPRSLMARSTASLTILFGSAAMALPPERCAGLIMASGSIMVARRCEEMACQYPTAGSVSREIVNICTKPTAVSEGQRGRVRGDHPVPMAGVYLERLLFERRAQRWQRRRRDTED